MSAHRTSVCWKYNSFSDTPRLLGALSWNSCFFFTVERYCYLKKRTDKYDYPDLSICRCFLNKWSELVTQGYHLTVIVANDKIWVLRKKWQFWKTCASTTHFPLFFSYMMSLTVSPDLVTFLMRLLVILTNMNFLYCIILTFWRSAWFSKLVLFRLPMRDVTK